MQNKGVIRFFVIAFVLVCIYQLSFTFITKKVEKDAKEFAYSEEVDIRAKKLSDGNPVREKIILDSLHRTREKRYLDSMSNEVVYNILVRKYTYQECKERELNLGLDLKGGMNVTLKVSVKDIILAMSDYSQDSTFQQALEIASERQKSSQHDYITLFADAFEELDPNAKLAAIFSTVDLKDKISFNSTNEEVLDVLREEAQSSIDRTFNILRTRIDRFGVTQPNIQKLGGSGRILVELPGVKEPDRVRKLLQGTAKLEFWETYEFAEVYQYLAEANRRLRVMYAADEAKQESEDTVEVINDDNAAVQQTDTVEEAEPSLIEQMQNDELADNANDTGDKPSLVDQIEGDTSAIAEGQQSFEEFAKENPLFAYLQLAIVQDPETGNQYPNQGPRVGYASLLDTGKVNKMLRDASAVFPRNLKFFWTVKPPKGADNVLELIAIKVTKRDGQPPLDGEVITDARQDFDQSGNVEISMTMNSEGAKTWKRLTGDNIGKAIAIVLDGYVYSFPVVNQEIPSGRSQISGDFSIEEGKDLANILKAGKLPAPARIVEEAVVGPSLGQEAINSGLISFALAFVIILIYMLFYYNKAGMVADIALFANVFFLFGVLASLQAVLTLPGIAGIVLTLGMAVDANVIIFERVREEIRAGKGLRLAIQDGYKNAYSAIIDGNVTTILTGIVLYVFGSGPVQGFATTLIIGILTSLFSAIFITRLVFTFFLKRQKNIAFGNKLTINVMAAPKYKFLEKRRIAYIISAIVIVIGLGSLFTKGLNYGVDFSGGRTYVVRFDNNVSTVDLRTSLGNTLEITPEVKQFGPSSQVKITTKYLIDDEREEADSIVERSVYEGVKDFFKTEISYKEFTSDEEGKLIGRLSSQKVGPTIADDIKRAAVMAAIIALIIVFIYIAIRFRKWQFGVGGLIALVHNTIITISLYSIFYGVLPFNLEVDQAFIAAILTIIGYSINDTVIIFDRIREFNNLYPKRSMKDNINSALNSTLSRTINTSGTTFVVLLMIFIFGGEIIRGFAFAMMVGILIGTYASIFNATPIAFDLIREKKEKKSKKALKK